MHSVKVHGVVLLSPPSSPSSRSAHEQKIHTPPPQNRTPRTPQRFHTRIHLIRSGATTTGDTFQLPSHQQEKKNSERLFEIFGEISECVRDLDAIRRITLEALIDFAEGNHVAYLELRSTPKNDLMVDDRFCTKREYVECILDVLKEFEMKEKQRYRVEKRALDDYDDDVRRERMISLRLPLVPRFIVSIDRSGTIEEAEENAKIALDLYLSKNPYVVGVDLGGNPTKNDFRDFEPLLKRIRDAGLRISVHCGEIPCGESENESNPILARTYQEAKSILQFRPDRLGHALLLPSPIYSSLSNNPIHIESCPTSNVLTLGLLTNEQQIDDDDNHNKNLIEALRRGHPRLSEWLSRSYPISISTDDPGVFDTNSTKEFWLLSEAFGLDGKKLRSIIEISLGGVFEPRGELRSKLERDVLERIDLLLETYEC